MESWVLQICPHDEPPFDTLCRKYAQAFKRINTGVTTIILGPPEHEPVPDFVYLQQRDLRNTKSLKIALMNHLRDNVSGAEPALVLCHRYRAYRAALAGGLPAQRVVALAHEYGMFRSAGRRLHKRLLAPAVRLAGVSQPIADELAGPGGGSLVLPNVIDTTRT